MPQKDAQRQVGIIRKPHFGLRDVGVPVLSFEIYVSEASAALCVISEWEEIRKVFIEGRITDLPDLNGKPCWCLVSPGMIVFDKMWSR